MPNLERGKQYFIDGGDIIILKSSCEFVSMQSLPRRLYFEKEWDNTTRRLNCMTKPTVRCMARVQISFIIVNFRISFLEALELRDGSCQHTKTHRPI